MKKLLSLTLALVLVLSLGAAALAADEYTVTIVNGADGSEAATFKVPAGEDFVFSISCAPPADMGPVAEGEEGAGVACEDAEIAYSNVTLGGPHAYPTAETVTLSEIKGDVTVTVTINPDEVGGEFPEITEGEISASGEPSGDPSGEASSGEPSGGMPTEADYEITVNGVTDTAHYEDTDNGDQVTKTFKITFGGKEIEGAIDKGVWTAADKADQAVVEAVQKAFESNNMAGPQQ